MKVIWILNTSEYRLHLHDSIQAQWELEQKSLSLFFSSRPQQFQRELVKKEKQFFTSEVEKEKLKEIRE